VENVEASVSTIREEAVAASVAAAAAAVRGATVVPTPPPTPSIVNVAHGFKADKKPLVFNGDSSLHPVKFLNELESYFRLNRVNDVGLKKEIAVRCLEGAADNWVGPRRETLATFEDFKAAFLHRYWGEARQEEVRAEIYKGKYDKECGLTFADYFNKILNLARYLTIPMSDATVMKHIASHYPARVGRILVGLGGKLII
jgi:hypothetical protein